MNRRNRTYTRERKRVLQLGILLTVVVLLVASLVFLSSNGSGNTDGEIDIDRTDDELTVSVEEIQFSELTVEVRQDGDTIDEIQEDEPAEQIEPYSLVDDLDLPPDVNLSAAEVFVELRDEEREVVGNETATLDLRLVSLAEDTTLETSVFNLTAEEVVGGGAELAATVGDGTWQFDVHPGNESVNLSTDLADHTEAQHGVQVGETEFTLIPDSPGNVTAERDLTALAGEPDSSVDGDALVYEHDLLVEGGTYRVGTAEQSDGEDATVETYGELTVPENVTDRLLAAGGGDLAVRYAEESLGTVTVSADEEEIRDLSWSVVEPSASLDGDSISVTHPALVDGEEYEVTIEVDGERQETELAATDGELRLPQPGSLRLVPAGELSLAIDEDGHDVSFEGSPDFSPRPVTATIEDGRMNVTDGDDALDLDSADEFWLNTTVGIERFGADRLSGQQVNLTEVDISVAEDETREALVLADGNVTRLELSFENGVEQSEPAGGDDGDEGVGALDDPLQMNVNPPVLGGSVVLLALLVVLSVGTPRLTERITTTQRDIALVGGCYLIGLAVTLYTFVEPGAFGLLWIGSAVAAGLLTGGLVYAYARTGDLSGLFLGLGVGTIALGAFVLGAAIEPVFLSLAVGGGYGLLGGLFVVGYDRLVVAGGVGGPGIAVTAVVRDEQTGQEITKPVGLTFLREDSQVTADGYRETVELAPGSWEVIVRSGGEKTRSSCRVTAEMDELSIPVSGTALDVRVGNRHGEAVGEATVYAEAVDATDDWEASTMTDTNGRCTIHAPFGTDRVSMTVDHEKYEPATYQVNAAEQEVVDAELHRRTGTLVVTARLGRETVPDVTITATPRTGGTQPLTRTTDAHGQATFEGVPAGPYDLSAQVPGDSSIFTIEAGAVTVEEDARRSAAVDISFEYTLSREARNRISALRDRLGDLSRSSRRDDAIQFYYTSVLRRVLDELDRVPQSGRLFLEHGEDPTAVVDATLAAVESMTDMLEDVLTSKHNVNLFSACSDLPAAEVRWSGTASVDELLSQADRDLGQQRESFGDRLEAVDERITEELRTLAEVSPAREAWEGTRDVVRERSGGDHLTTTALLYVGFLLLDAIESLFEQPELRKRLEQTVY